MVIKGLDNTNLGILWSILKGKFVGNIKMNGEVKSMIDGQVDLGNLASQSDFDTLKGRVDQHDTDIAAKVNKSAIKQVSGASEDDIMSQKGITDFVNSTVNSISAFYLTADAEGNAFATKAALDAATELYYAGEKFVPTKNDYLLIMADETHDGAACRYVYQGEDGKGVWAFQYKVNDAPLTSAQVAALNSGITAALVQKISDNESAITNLQENKADKATTLEGYGITDASVSGRTVSIAGNSVEVPEWQALTKTELEAIFS